MLRSIKSVRVAPFIQGAQLQSANPNFTAPIGNDDLASLVYVSTGRGTYVTRNVFSRTPALHCTGGVNCANGGTMSQHAATTAVTGQIRNNTTAGAVVDGDGDILIAGNNSSEVIANTRISNFTQAARLRGNFNNPILATARITGASGAIVFGSGWITASRSSAGVYVINFKRGFGLTPLVYVQPIGAGLNLRAKVSAKSASSCTVNIFSSAPTATDCDFYIWVYGTLSRDYSGRHFKEVRTPMRKPRFMYTAITTSAGSPIFTFTNVDNIEFGSSITDNGTGDYTLSFTGSFAREPAILIGSTSVAMVHTTSASSVRIQTNSYGGGLSDVTDACYIMILGSDDSNEYQW